MCSGPVGQRRRRKVRKTGHWKTTRVTRVKRTRKQFSKQIISYVLQSLEAKMLPVRPFMCQHMVLFKKSCGLHMAAEFQVSHCTAFAPGSIHILQHQLQLTLHPSTHAVQRHIHSPPQRAAVPVVRGPNLKLDQGIRVLSSK